MANYSAPCLLNGVSTSFKSTGILSVSATARRIQLYEAEFGQATGSGGYATTDVSCQWDISRILTTATMAATVVATNLLDPADIASLTLFANNATAEPTIATAGAGLSLKSWGINQRGSYRWRALDDGDNILVAATATLGLTLRTLSGGFTFSAVGSLAFIER